MFVFAVEYWRGPLAALDNRIVSVPVRRQAGTQPVFGGYGGGVTPVPILNTAVKPACADGTWDECPWESRSPPDFERYERGLWAPLERVLEPACGPLRRVRCHHGGSSGDR